MPNLSTGFTYLGTLVNGLAYTGKERIFGDHPTGDLQINTGTTVDEKHRGDQQNRVDLKMLCSLLKTQFTISKKQIVLLHFQSWALAVLGEVFRYYRKWLFLPQYKIPQLLKNTKYKIPKVGWELAVF